MKDKELEITLNADNTISFSDYIDTRIAYEIVCQEKNKEIERLNNIINKALEKSKGLQYRFGYVLDDLIYLLMQGSDKE